MKIHEILKEDFFNVEYVDLTDDVHRLAREIGNCNNRIRQQRSRLAELERIQAGYATYWQRRALAAEQVLREMGDEGISKFSPDTSEPMSSHYLRRFLELQESFKQYRTKVEDQRQHEYWGHVDL